jgi:hypothetical protein
MGGRLNLIDGSGTFTGGEWLGSIIGCGAIGITVAVLKVTGGDGIPTNVVGETISVATVSLTSMLVLGSTVIVLMLSARNGLLLIRRAGTQPIFLQFKIIIQF